MVTGEDIVAYARGWIGARWRHQGRGHGRDRGIDCAGLLVRTAQHFGLPHEDLIGYRRDPGREFQVQIERYTDPFDQPINGAIGIFTDTLMPCHTGIFAVDAKGRVTVIHSECGLKRRCHEESYDLNTQSLKSRLRAIRLFREVDYGL
jgi:Cell wall-associated hydrolases (invasion-associated proteins)